MRELNIQQKTIILEEVKRNIQQGSNNLLDNLAENHYKISTDTYFKCMELNDHETYHDNVENYLQELRNYNLEELVQGNYQVDTKN
jgi:beta-galactosidase beta subunit